MMLLISVACGLFLLILEERSHVPWRVLLQWSIQLLAWFRWHRTALPVPVGDCWAALHCFWPDISMNLIFHSWGILIQPKSSRRASLLHEAGPVTHVCWQTSMCCVAILDLLRTSLVTFRINSIHISSLFLRKENAICSLPLREYAISTKGTNFASTVESVTTLQKLDHRNWSAAYSGLRKQCKSEICLTSLEIAIAHMAPFYSTCPWSLVQRDFLLHSSSTSTLRSQFKVLHLYPWRWK